MTKDKAGVGPANPYAGLRNIALSATQERLGLNLPADPVVVFGVVVDWGMGKGVATITSFVSGEASIYMSAGGGFLGGVGRPWINAAAKRCIPIAQRLIAEAEKRDEDALPEAGIVAFHLLTTQGRFYARQKMTDLVAPANPWQPIFRAVNEVLAGYRQLHEQVTKEP